MNGKRYVGSAVKLRIRKYKHWHALNNNYHRNKHLQNHVNKHGIEVLNFSVLEYCEIDLLIPYEQYHLDTLKPEFNICLVAESRLGLICTKETRRKISKALKGKILSEEHRRKVSEGNKGRIVSEETRRKISEAHKGLKHSEKSRRKMSKTVYQYDKNTGAFIAEFNSLTEAAKSINGVSSGISPCACGKRKSAYGFIWKYIKL